MIQTYFLEVDLGIHGRTFVETYPGRSESSVIDQICNGDTAGAFRNIYRVSLGECEEVTDEVAKKVIALGGPFPAATTEWLEWVGYDMREAAE